MNRDEKNLQKWQKIVDAALLEFSEKGYAEGSLNAICAAGEISKGIIYHYFKDKDALYLYCVKECFDALTEYLYKKVIIADVPIKGALEGYFDARIAFFAENPLYLKLFCNVIMAPPAHLRTALEVIKSDFDALNISALNRLLARAKLRGDMTIAEVVEFFRDYQDFINMRFQMQTFNELSLEEHEKRCSSSLKILLYGVIECGGDAI